MNRYNNGKIYKIYFNNYFFIGYTCTSLSKRLYYHKQRNDLFRDRPISECRDYLNIDCNNPSIAVDNSPQYP